MLALKEAQAVTGYIRGGVTALACKKDYPVYLDELAEVCDVISVSAGIRGLQILLAPDDYIRAVSRSYRKAEVIAVSHYYSGRKTKEILPGGLDRITRSRYRRTAKDC
jgi:Cys-tRNA(Pro)/Cys-tRNA(Cys) deacylase